jgi:3-methyladenine DNA glycosylase AlkD
MTLKEILNELKEYGDDGLKKTLTKHGAKEPFYGVKVGDMKKIVKKVKKDHYLALELYSTGNTDAMYLAGLIADEKKITKEDLNNWVKKAYWYMLSEYTVAQVAAETEFGFELANEWIESDKPTIQAAGWATLSNLASISPDNNIDLFTYSQLLTHISENIDLAANRVKYAMNGFVIAVGSYIKPLNDKAIKVAESIGKIKVDMGDTSCKVPYAFEYLNNVIEKKGIGVKRKSARC